MIIVICAFWKPAIPQTWTSAILGHRPGDRSSSPHLHRKIRRNIILPQHVPRHFSLSRGRRTVKRHGKKSVDVITAGPVKREPLLKVNFVLLDLFGTQFNIRAHAVEIQWVARVWHWLETMAAEPHRTKTMLIVPGTALLPATASVDLFLGRPKPFQCPSSQQREAQDAHQQVGQQTGQRFQVTNSFQIHNRGRASDTRGQRSSFTEISLNAKRLAALINISRIGVKKS